jgi:Icc-related predicted phosphoesterase
MSEIQDQSKPWYEVTGAQVNRRAAQNNAQILEMLMNSITQSAKNQVQVYEDEYLLSNAGTPEKKVGNAAALYKVIMRLTTLDTKSTNKSLRDRLKDLPTVVVTVNGDVDALHTSFNNVYNQLKTHGENVDDKEDILFAAYANIPDGKFQAYMEKKESYWDEEVNDMQGKD